jgi:hypothetical protein
VRAIYEQANRTYTPFCRSAAEKLRVHIMSELHFITWRTTGIIINKNSGAVFIPAIPYATD